jgi:hypothetical protein
MGGWVGGWMDGWMVGRMNGWIWGEEEYIVANLQEKDHFEDQHLVWMTKQK